MRPPSRTAAICAAAAGDGDGGRCDAYVAELNASVSVGSGSGTGGVCASEATAMMAVTHAAALTGLLSGGGSGTRPFSARTRPSCARSATETPRHPTKAAKTSEAAKASESTSGPLPRLGEDASR
jgi:hypothetical protein